MQRAGCRSCKFWLLRWELKEAKRKSGGAPADSINSGFWSISVNSINSALRAESGDLAWGAVGWRLDAGNNG